MKVVLAHYRSSYLKKKLYDNLDMMPWKWFSWMAKFSLMHNMCFFVFHYSCGFFFSWVIDKEVCGTKTNSCYYALHPVCVPLRVNPSSSRQREQAMYSHQLAPIAALLNPMKLQNQLDALPDVQHLNELHEMTVAREVLPDHAEIIVDKSDTRIPYHVSAYLEDVEKDKVQRMLQAVV